MLCWAGKKINKAATSVESASSQAQGDQKSKEGGIKDAWNVIKSDRRIMQVGAIQALFEGAMYIFVIQWVPALKRAIAASRWGAGAIIPLGKVFSCFMVCCLLGTTVFGAAQTAAVPIETTIGAMLTLATAAMVTAASAGATSLTALLSAFLLFEACVGMYFPAIGTLRSKYVPDSHRSVIMNLFGLPLNAIVVTVFLSMKALGIDGALAVSSGCLLMAATSGIALARSLRPAAATQHVTDARPKRGGKSYWPVKGAADGP